MYQVKNNRRLARQLVARLAALLWMSIVLSAVIGTVKREPPFDIALNYWDEAVAYAALFALISNFNQAA
jgi:hypothetical protein